MDDSLKELECELHNLTPQAPRAACVERLAAELGRDAVAAPAWIPSRRRYRTATSWTSWKWANWTVAAGLIVMMYLAADWAPSPSLGYAGKEGAVTTSASAAALQPVRAARTLVDSRMEALLELPDGSPVQRVRDYYVDTIEWRDPNDGALLRWELPREAVRFVALTPY
ncbi:MAG: hypothetical protein ACN6I3_00010 [bacterium]